jgi:hypothetical protein
MLQWFAEANRQYWEEKHESKIMALFSALPVILFQFPTWKGRIWDASRYFMTADSGTLCQVY